MQIDLRVTRTGAVMLMLEDPVAGILQNILIRCIPDIYTTCKYYTRYTPDITRYTPDIIPDILYQILYQMYNI